MGDVRLVPLRRSVRLTAALAVLPALFCAALADAAQADDGTPGPSVTVTAPTASPSPTGTGTPTTPTPEATPAPTTVPPTTAPKPPTAPKPATTGPTLRQGARGAAVLRLQRRLRELGYDVGKVHSIFADDTLHAVRAFQKVQGAKITGVVNAATWRQLAHPVIPTPRYTEAKAAVEVDLTARVLYLTRNGAVTAIFDVSPGKPSTPTVTGRYSIYRRVNRWDHGPLGGLYKPNYFHRGYALHGSLSVPTYAASHGCIRLTTSSMDRLWPKLSKSEHVTLYRS